MYYIQNKNKEVTILQLLIMPGLQVSEFYDNSLIVNEHGRLSTHVGSGSIDSVPLTVQGVVRFRCCLYEQIITNLRPEKMLSLFITTEIYLYLWVNEMSDRSQYSSEQDLSELGTKLNKSKTSLR